MSDTLNGSAMPAELPQDTRFHLIGIGGSGMSAIARVLLGRGYAVAGSDMQANEQTSGLRRDGATIYQGHSAAYLGDATLVVISSAVSESNPEVKEARRRDIPVIKRADLLGELMQGAIGIAIAGTHGKTTTTGMIAQILLEAEQDPTVIIGGTLPLLGSNGRFGNGPYFVVEADEYDNMFLGLRPELSVITNVEHDHPDIFATGEAYREAFRAFVRLLPGNGRLVACADDPGVASVLNGMELEEVEVTSYGLNGPLPRDGKTGERAHIRAVSLQPNNLGGTDFVVSQDGQTIGLIRLRVPGQHNVLNALAAVIVALDLQIDFSQIQQALAAFDGVERRFQVLGEAGGVIVIDDYAHHPTEIQATLSAARQRFPGRRLWAVWQPHTFSRTRLLLDRFADSFSEADRVVALDVYRSREADNLGIGSEDVLAQMNHPDATFIAENDDAVGYLLERLLPDDVVIMLSAGDGNVVGQDVLRALKQRVNQRGFANA